MIKNITISLVLIATILTSIYLFASYSFESHSSIQKNSVAYFLLLDSEIAHIPMAQTSNDVIFKTFAQDGTAPAIDEASIGGLSDIQKAITETEIYFTELGYTWQTVCEFRCVKTLTKNSATLSIYSENNRLEIVKSSI